MSGKFKGGIHPPHRKLTSEKPIESLDPPDEIVVPLSQHTGAPAKPTVEKGAEVKVGTRIGEAQGYISAHVHSPVSGVVKSILEKPHPTQTGLVPSVVIEVKGTESEDFKEDPNWEDASPESIRERVLAAGIVGMGGAAFPTHVKLNPPKEYPVDTVIINGGECEPYLTPDDRLMREYPEDIVRGAHLIRQAVGAKRVIIGIEDNKPEAVKAMRDAAKAYGFEVSSLHSKYPQGSEKQLIKALLGREVPSGGLPFHVGVLVQNVGTAKAIYEAVRFGRPLTERVLTLSGFGAKGPGNYMVKIGTPFSHIIEKTGGASEDTVKIISGGPLMGIAVWTTEVPVIKCTSGILLLTSRETSDRQEGPCIRCGTCVEVCPMGLSPYLIARESESGFFDRARAHHVLDCIECGSCAYACPARRHLVQHIRYGKSEVWKLIKKEKEEAVA
ncbi:MAG: electron transport complex subunit RsxC [candidate division WOR-3 bacterium]